MSSAIDTVAPTSVADTTATTLSTTGQTAAAAAATSGCLLPFIEGTRKEATNKIGVTNDFIPSDLLLSLKRFSGDQSPPPKSLPPSRRNPALPPNKQSPALVRRPANMWSYPNRRRKFKHLTDNSPCVCGAGKDISFLYDIQADEDDDSDVTKVDNNASSQSIPITLIPKEYHIVKHPGVLGLEFHDDSYSSKTTNHDHHITIFPSMRPSGRHEVAALKHTMTTMLERAGVGKMHSDSDLKGPTSMHNLLELVQKEQDIYNIIFHELIRQVSVHCVERGELLAELRTRYSNLLDRIPRQVKDLHNEVIAQRALDRRLTSELKKFKATIASLTTELAEVKEYNCSISELAETAQEDLANAVADSQRSACTLTKYHELYELQRKRLESQVAILNQERNIWQQSAYDLAYRVAEEHNLHSVRKLQLCEKSWVKLTSHFSLVLRNMETRQLSDVEYKVMIWKDKILDFASALEDMEHEIKRKLQVVEQKLQQWILEFQAMMDEETGVFSAPNDSLVHKLWMDIQQFEDIFSQESEHFAGETLLAKQEIVKSLAELVEQWTDISMKVFVRHQFDSNAEEFEMMQSTNANVDQLLSEYSVRVSGENGIATSFLHLLTPMETWDTKLNTVLTSGKTFPDSEWFKLQILLEEWLDKVEDTIRLIGKPTASSNMAISDECDINRAIPAQQLVMHVDKWKSALINVIDSQNAKLSEQILQTHMLLVQWMANALLKLSQAKHLSQGLDNTDEEPVVADFANEFTALSSSMDAFTKHLSNCCEDIVAASAEEEAQEHQTGQQNEIKRMTMECEQWAKMAALLLQELGLAGDKTATPPATTITQKDDIAKQQGESTTAQKEVVPEQTPAETSDSRDGVQLLGEDENVHKKPLEEMITKASNNLDPVASTAKLELVEEDAIPSHSPVLQDDAEKLVIKVDELEGTIKEQHKRVQEAEELARESKQQLALSMDRINELEAELAELKKTTTREGQNNPSSRGRKSAGRKTSRVAESPLKKKTN